MNKIKKSLDDLDSEVFQENKTAPLNDIAAQSDKWPPDGVAAGEVIRLANDDDAVDEAR